MSPKTPYSEEPCVIHVYTSILLPTDGSSPAEAAARYGVALANRFGATLQIMSVVDTRKYSDTHPRAHEQQAALEDHAQDAVTALADIIEETADVSYTSTIKYGIPYETIPTYALEHDSDLIVMGTHGRSGLDRAIVGSITERVVRTSDVPVFAVPPPAHDHSPTGYDAILIPTDGSAATNVAVEHGLSIAERFDARVHILSVVVTGVGLLTPSDTDHEEANEAVDSIAEKASQRGIEVSTHIQEGDPSETVRTFITDQDIDLVTMGTHGRTGTERYFIGSVTEKIVRTSDVPVITVRGPTPD